MTKEIMADILGVACTIYNRTLSSDLVNAYYLILEKYEVEKVRDAFMRCFRNNLDFPKPATLLNIISPQANLT